MKTKLIVTSILIFLSFMVSLSAQDNDMKWTFGFNSSAVLFQGEGKEKVKDELNAQFPSLQISKKISKNFLVDLVYTFEGIEVIKDANAFPYSSLVAYLRYDLPELFLNIVPAIGVGLGYVNGASTVPDALGALSVNVMAGGTFWLTKRIGLSGRLIYKLVSPNSLAMVSHVQGVAGIVYKFEINLRTGENRKRIWEK
jgi:hypothetical protein